MTENSLRESERESPILLFAMSFTRTRKMSARVFHFSSRSFSPLGEEFSRRSGSGSLSWPQNPYVAGCADGTVSASLVCVGCDEVALQSLFEHP